MIRAVLVRPLVFKHGVKGFVVPTKSFVKIGITKIFCYNNKMFSSINKTFGCCNKIFVCSNKNNICCPQFSCCNKTIFFRDTFGSLFNELNVKSRKGKEIMGCALDWIGRYSSREVRYIWKISSDLNQVYRTL